MINPIDDLESAFNQIVKTMDVDPSLKQFHRQPQQDGSAHIEAIDGEFHYVVTDQGQELTRIKSANADDILYLLVSDITGALARQYELTHRDHSRDGREISMPYHVQLLAAIKPAWGDRQAAEYAKILSLKDTD
jgi:Immunity protein 63